MSLYLRADSFSVRTCIHRFALLGFVMRRIGSVVDKAIQQGTQSNLGDARDGEDRAQFALRDRLVDVRQNVLFVERALFEILLHQMIVRFGDQLDETFAVLSKMSRPSLGNIDPLLVHRRQARKLSGGPHRRRRESPSFPIGNVKGNDRSTESILRGLERGAEVRMFLVELVNHHERGDQKLVGVGPGLFGLHLYAFHSVDDDDRAISNAQRGAGVGYERRVSGRIDKIQFCIVMFEMGE